MIQFVYRPKRTKNGQSVVARLYRGCFRLDGDLKRTTIPLRTPDKQVAEKRLREHVNRLQQERDGIRLPKLSMESLALPVERHVRDYIADKQKTGKDRRYVDQQSALLLRLFNECEWKTLADITPEQFLSWRQRHSASAKTLNEYLGSANTFLKWVIFSKRLSMENPLRHVAKISTVGQETYHRRPFGEEEFKRLLAVSEYRAPVYLTAVHTGLRRKELKTLTWANLSLDSEMPTVTVTAINAKNRKAQPLPLHPDVVTVLRELREQHQPKPTDRVFFGIFPKWETYRRDLERAGIQNFDDPAGKLHFHSLRHTLNHRLQEAGVVPTVAQHLMRHSSIALTTRTYINASSLPLASAICRVRSVLRRDSPIDSPKSDADGLFESHAVAGSENTDGPQKPINTESRRNLTVPVVDSRESENGARYRVRTCDPCRVKAVLYH